MEKKLKLNPERVRSYLMVDEQLKNHYFSLVEEAIRHYLFTETPNSQVVDFLKSSQILIEE
jgi:hypothetical protein